VVVDPSGLVVVMDPSGFDDVVVTEPSAFAVIPMLCCGALVVVDPSGLVIVVDPSAFAVIPIC
jgi:hypothetical protein